MLGSRFDLDLAQRFSSLTGLDEPTVQSQILPYLQSLGTAKEARNYLQDFLGSHSRDAQQLIESYIQHRFKKQDPPSRAPTPADHPKKEVTAGPAPVDMPKKQSNLPKLKDVDVIANMSPQAAEQLKRIDHTLKVMSAAPDSKLVQTSRCFCQSRMHAISDVSPICQACGLVLCSLNSPSAPCPSCLQSLVSAATLLAMRTKQLGERNKLIDAERARLYVQMEGEEEERRKIKFPTLASTAGHLSGATLSARIQQSYAEEPRKVLSLQLGSKKAVVHTTTKKAKAVGTAVEEEVYQEGWVDEDDLGWLKQQPNPPLKLRPQAPKLVYVKAQDAPSANGSKATTTKGQPKFNQSKP